MHIVDNVRQRIEAGLRDFVSEIRVCTVVFLGFPSLSVSEAAAPYITKKPTRNSHAARHTSRTSHCTTSAQYKDTASRDITAGCELVLTIMSGRQEERKSGGEPSVDIVQRAALLVQQRMQAHDGMCLQVSGCYAAPCLPAAQT